jgi:hypothetical protein
MAPFTGRVTLSHNSILKCVFVINIYVIVWLLDLQHPVQSVPITTKVVSSNPVYVEVFSIQQYVI